jgi:prevent-host-death family protein
LLCFPNAPFLCQHRARSQEARSVLFIDDDETAASGSGWLRRTGGDDICYVKSGWDPSEHFLQAKPDLILFPQKAYGNALSRATVSARQANHEFSDLLSRAERGEEILITKRSKPVAVLGPYRPPPMTAERKKAIQHAIDAMADGIS